MAGPPVPVRKHTPEPLRRDVLPSGAGSRRKPGYHDQFAGAERCLRHQGSIYDRGHGGEEGMVLSENIFLSAIFSEHPWKFHCKIQQSPAIIDYSAHSKRIF